MKGRTVGLLALGMLFGGVQSLEAQRITVGALGGVNFADVSTDDPDLNTDRLTAFQLGLFVALPVGERLEIRPEVLYSGKGFTFVDGSEEADLELTYIEIPILARVNLAPEAQVRPVVFAGPAVAFEASCEVSGAVEGLEIEADCDDPLVDLTRKTTDVGLVFGAGLDFDLGGAVGLIEGAFNLGLRSLDDDPEGSSTKSRVITLRAGIGIPVG